MSSSSWCVVSLPGGNWQTNGGSCEDGEGGCVEDMMLEEWALGIQGEVRRVVKLLRVQSPDFPRCLQVTSAPTWEDQTAEGAWGSPVEERPGFLWAQHVDDLI